MSKQFSKNQNPMFRVLGIYLQSFFSRKKIYYQNDDGCYGNDTEEKVKSKTQKKKKKAYLGTKILL